LPETQDEELRSTPRENRSGAMIPAEEKLTGLQTKKSGRALNPATAGKEPYQVVTN
jgi:hypothetical protein